MTPENPKPTYETLERDLAEMRATFDLRWKADMRAIKRWQDAHPGKELVWPDHADLVVWLLRLYDKAESHLETGCITGHTDGWAEGVLP